MILRPAVAGVRQILGQGADISIPEVMARLGQNTGNMMFTEAVNKVLVNSKPIGYQLSESELNNRDAIVFAAANWINPHGDFGAIAERLEKTDLPVFAIGVGAQSGLDKKIPRVPAGTLRFLKIISERSKSISTRGVFSSEVLEHYGIKNSVPTGCPSLLLTGRTGVEYTQRASLDAVTVHGTRHGMHDATDFQRLFYTEAYSAGYDVLLQSETADMIVAANDYSVGEKLPAAREFVAGAYGAPSPEAAEDFIKDHGKFFINYPTWIDYMKTRSFCFGTRIHGTVASLVAGTPGMLVAHDSRTLELAEAMGIPHISAEYYAGKSSLDLPEMLERFHQQAEHSVHNEYIQKFDDFFADNGLLTNY